jgi:lipopolysaccharide export system protein LptA
VTPARNHQAIVLRTWWPRLLFLVIAHAAPLGAQEDDPVVIDHANVIRRVEEGDSLTYFLEGNVRAHRGPVRMRSQLATIYRQSGIADFQRNVRFWDQTTEIFADQVVYEELTNVAVATGNVQMIDRDSGSQVVADTVHYFREEKLIIARPRPHGTLLGSDSTAQSDPFDVYADEMRFRSDSVGSTVVAVRRVLIERTDLTALADSLIYDDTVETVALRISPQVETEETFLRADRIDIQMTESEIESLVAVEGARTIDKTDSIPGVVPAAFEHVSQTSFLEGDSIYIAFADGGIDWLVAQGRARSLNYTRESPPGTIETWSVNYLLGERLRLNFRGDTLEQVVASGGHRGLYRSEDVRVGGVERRPSEPIPLPDLSATVGLIRATRRRLDDRRRG